MATSAPAEKLFEYRVDDNPDKKTPSYYLLWSVIRRGVVSLHWYAAGTMVAFLQVGLQFLLPIPNAIIVGSILPMVADPVTSSHGLITCCLAAASIRIISALVTLVYTYLTSEGSFSLMLHLRKRFLTDLEQMSDETKEGFGTGRIYTTYTTDLRSYAQFYQRFLPQLLAHSLKILGTFGIIYLLSPAIFCFLALVIPLQVILMSFFRWRIQHLHREVNRLRDEAMSLFNEGLVNNDLIKSFNAQDRITDRTIGKVEELIEKGRQSRNRRLIWTISSQVISMVFSVGIALISGLQVIDGTISLTFYIVINSYALTVLQPIQLLIGLFQEIIPLLVGVQWCEEFYGASEQQKGAQRPEKPPVQSHEVEFRGVTFRYPDTPETAAPALDEVSCRLPRGKITVLCGASGCGKTTMLKLLRGTLESPEGEVLLGGTDIRKIDAETLSRLVAILTQKISLLSMSILQNAELLSPKSKEEEVKESLRMARILEELEKMEQEVPEEVEDPDESGIGKFGRFLFGIRPARVKLLETRKGLDRVAGTSGNLSGGQQQRVSIGFALLTQCPILLFDEPTSGLDKTSENQVVESISALANGDRTIVVVTHTLPPYFVLPEDRVHFIYLSEGKLVGQGSRKELLKECPGFRELARQNVTHVLSMDKEDIELLIA